MKNNGALVVLVMLGCAAASVACGDHGSAEGKGPAVSEKPAVVKEPPPVREPEPEPEPVPVAEPVEVPRAVEPDGGVAARIAEPVGAPEAAGPAVAGDVELVETEGLMLESLVLAEGVEKRQPVNPGTSFSIAQSARIYAIMTVSNPAQTEAELSVSWAPGDGEAERGTVTVTVGAQKKWRTWAFTRTLSKPGQWTAIVRTAEGTIIGRAHFEMTP